MSASEDLHRLQQPDGAPVLPPPSSPLKVARSMAAELYTHPSGAATLYRWRGGWWTWQTQRWVEAEQDALYAAAYQFTERAVYLKGGAGDKPPEQVPWSPNRHKIGDLLAALAATVHLPESVTMPSWLDGRDAGVLVSTANGLLDVGSRCLLEHSPAYFNATAVPFDYQPAAPRPERWLTFLHELWADDSDAIAALQEWFGYTISGRTDQHKILLVVGPTRAGKGVIARLLGTLIGPDNVAGPTLTSLKTDFGLAPLIGKSLAVISDARLNGHGAHVVVERLLSVSGEDTLTVNRKYRDGWTGKLPARFMLCTNELPQLGDASGAIAGRMLTLILERSWLGSEDLELGDVLAGELPGILNWALDGLAMLGAAGRFTRPASADEAMIALQDLASPVAAFVRDCCDVAADNQVTVDALYARWRLWAEDNGHTRSTKQTFGRDLRAVVSRVNVTRPGAGDTRDRFYTGIALRIPLAERAELTLDIDPDQARADDFAARHPDLAGGDDA